MSDTSTLIFWFVICGICFFLIWTMGKKPPRR